MCSSTDWFRWQNGSEGPVGLPQEGGNYGNDFITKKEILTVMAKFFQSRNFVVDKYEFKPMITPNILPYDEYFRLVVTVTTSQAMNKEYTFFAKKLPRMLTNCHEKAFKDRAFHKEVEVYSTLFHDLEKMQGGTVPWAPMCYFSRPGQFLVLEDLTLGGYYQVGRRECLDKEHILAVMKSLAAFHAASIKFEENFNFGRIKPSTTKYDICAGTATIGDVYLNINYETDAVKLKCHPENVTLNAAITSQTNLIDKLPGYSRAELEVIKKKLPDLLLRTGDWLKPSARFYNVFTHGDICTNNIFFRRNADGTLEAMLIDYQMTRYAPPALDILMLLYNTQRRDFRSREMQTLIKLYHNFLSDELSKNNISIESVFSAEEYLASFEEYENWALPASLLYLQMYLLTEEAIENYIVDPISYTKNITSERTEMITKCYTTDEIYHTWMTELMNDVIKKYIEL